MRWKRFFLKKDFLIFYHFFKNFILQHHQLSQTQLSTSLKLESPSMNKTSFRTNGMTSTFSYHLRAFLSSEDFLKLFTSSRIPEQLLLCSRNIPSLMACLKSTEMKQLMTKTWVKVSTWKHRTQEWLLWGDPLMTSIWPLSNLGGHTQTGRRWEWANAMELELVLVLKWTKQDRTSF